MHISDVINKRLHNLYLCIPYYSYLLVHAPVSAPLLEIGALEVNCDIYNTGTPANFLKHSFSSTGACAKSTTILYLVNLQEFSCGTISLDTQCFEINICYFMPITTRLHYTRSCLTQQPCLSKPSARDTM